MTFLPIVDRELRVASRRLSTYATRAVSALAAMGLCVWALVVMSRFASMQQSGAQLFRTLSWLAFFYALIAGARLTADCLSEEKREGTLGLLFLTDLKGYDVILGKLAATSLSGAYGFLAMVPVLAIPILMGGVTAGDFWRTILVLADTLFLSLAAGIFVSCVSRVERKAMGGTLVALSLITWSLPFLAEALWHNSTGGWPDNLLRWASPWVCFSMAFSGPATRTGNIDFWWSLLVIQALGWIFLGLASGIVPHVWKDKPGSRRTANWRDRWHRLLYGSAEYRTALRRRLLEINPICWLSSRERLSRYYPWIFLTAMVVIWFGGFAQMKGDWLQPGFVVLVTYVIHLVFKYWLATLACYSFAADRHQGGLELLLSTPLTIKEMLRGQWLALWRCLGWPVIAVLICELVLICASFSTPWWRRNEESYWGVLLVGNPVMFLLDLVTLGWVGMWMGVNAKQAQRSVSKTIGRVLLWPSMIAVFCGIVIAPRVGPGGAIVIPILWIIAGLCTDVLVGPWAYLRMHNDLRRVVAPRYASGKEDQRWWRVLFSKQ